MTTTIARLRNYIRLSLHRTASMQRLGNISLSSVVRQAKDRLECLQDYGSTWDFELDGEAVTVAIGIDAPLPDWLRDDDRLRAIAIVLQQELGIEKWQLIGSDKQGLSIAFVGGNLSIGEAKC